MEVEETSDQMPSAEDVQQAFGMRKETPKNNLVKVNPMPEQIVSEMAGTSNYEETIQKAISKDENKKRQLAEKVLSTKQKPADAHATIKSIIHRLHKIRSNGEATAEIIGPQDNKNTKKTLASDLDTASAKELNNQAILQNIGVSGKSYKQAMEDPDPTAYETAKILTKNHPKEAKKLKDEFDEGDFSRDDWVNFFNPIGDDAPDGHDFDFWQMTKDIVSLDFDYDEFDKNMESNYGKDWEMRFTGWMVKEGITDGALLFSFMHPAGLLARVGLGGIAAYNKATATARVGAAGVRAAIIASGGTAAQVAQNEYLESMGETRDTDVTGEFIGRFAGSLGVDALTYGAKAAYRKLTGDTIQQASKQIAKDIGKKPMSQADFKAAMSSKQFETSEGAGLVKARLYGQVENYQNTMNKISSGVMTATNKQRVADLPEEIREGLAQVIGKDVTELDDIPMDLAFNQVKVMETASVKLGKDSVTKMATSKLDNDGLINRGLIYHVLGKSIGEYENLSKNFNMYFSDLNIQLRETDVNIIKSAMPVIDNFMKLLGISEARTFAGRSADNLGTATDFSNKVANGFQALYKDAVGTPGTPFALGKKDRSIVEAMLQEGSHRGVVFPPNGDLITPQTIPYPITPQAYKAYAKLRIGLDLAHEIFDASQTAANKGTLSSLKTGENITNKIFKTKDDTYHMVTSFKDGKVTTKRFDRNRFSPIEATKGYKSPKVSELMEIDTIVPYRNGYLPRTYTTQSRSVMLVDPNNLKVSRVGMSNTRREADAFAKQLQEAAPDQMAFVTFSNSATNFGGVTAGKNTIDALSGLSKSQKDVVTEQLKAFGVDGTNLERVVRQLGKPQAIKRGSAKPTDLGTATTKAGQKARVDYYRLKTQARQATDPELKKQYEADAAKIEAKINKLPSESDISIYNEVQVPVQSVIEYMGMVAQNAGQANWRRAAIDHWHTMYGKGLHSNVSWRDLTLSNYRSNFNEKILTAKQQADAFRMSKWIQRHVTKSTSAEKMYDNLLANTEKRLSEAAEDSKIAKAALYVFENAPLAKQINSSLRGVAAVTKLLFFAPAQLIVQSSQAMSTIGAGLFNNPVQITKSLMRMPLLAGFSVADAAKIRLPKAVTNSSNYKVYKELVASGYAADLATTDTLFMLKHKYNPHPGTAAMNFIKKAGMMPFRGGEAINRVMAYVSVRDQFANTIRVGKKQILDFDGKALKESDIGSYQFREAVKEKAKVLALDMSKAGELQSMSGFGSVLFQFKQVMPKQASLFTSGRLSKMEKLGALGLMTGVWGPTAVLLAPDVLKFGDWANYEFFGDADPNKRFVATDKARAFADWFAEDGFAGMSEETTKNLLNYGALAAATDNEIMLSNRVALGLFISDTFDVNHWTDSVVSVAILKDMYEAARKLGIAEVDIATGATIGGKTFGVKGAAIGATAGAILNPFSFFDILSRVQSGQDFKTAIAPEFDPESAIGKLLDGDMELGKFSYDAMRAVGGVLPIAGGISRRLDANNQHIVNPTAHALDPWGERYYMTRNFTPTGVKQTPLGDLLSSFGITPGKVVEAQNKESLKRLYKDALTDYNRNITRRLKEASGDDDIIIKITNEYIVRMDAFKQLMLDKGMDVSVAADISKSIGTKTKNTILQAVQGGGKN